MKFRIVEDTSTELSSQDMSELKNLLNGTRDANMIDAFIKTKVAEKNPQQQEALTEEEDSDWQYIASKTVTDSDGFTTDYTWYRNGSGMNIFIFGDNDFYGPEDTEPDFETESDAEATEWFDDYTGFEEDEYEESFCKERTKLFDEVLEEEQEEEESNIPNVYQYNYDEDDVDNAVKYCKEHNINYSDMQPWEFEYIVIRANGYEEENWRAGITQEDFDKGFNEVVKEHTILKESAYSYSGWDVSDDLQKFIVTTSRGKDLLVSAMSEDDALDQVEPSLDSSDSVADIHLATEEEIDSYYDASHASEWEEKHPYGYYNDESDYGVDESLTEEASDEIAYEDAVSWMENNGFSCDPTTLEGEYVCDALDSYDVLTLDILKDIRKELQVYKNAGTFNELDDEFNESLNESQYDNSVFRIKKKDLRAAGVSINNLDSDITVSVVPKGKYVYLYGSDNNVWNLLHNFDLQYSYEEVKESLNESADLQDIAAAEDLGKWDAESSANMKSKSEFKTYCQEEGIWYSKDQYKTYVDSYTKNKQSVDESLNESKKDFYKSMAHEKEGECENDVTQAIVWLQDANNGDIYKYLRNNPIITEMEIETNMNWDEYFWDEFDSWLENHPLRLEFYVEDKSTNDSTIYYYGKIMSKYSEFDDNGAEWGYDYSESLKESKKVSDNLEKKLTESLYSDSVIREVVEKELKDDFGLEPSAFFIDDDILMFMAGGHKCVIRNPYKLSPDELAYAVFTECSNNLEESVGSKKYLGKDIDELEAQLKSDGFEIDSADKSQPSSRITLYKNGKSYNAELTKYSNGDYEVMNYSIKPLEEDAPDPESRFTPYVTTSKLLNKFAKYGYEITDILDTMRVVATRANGPEQIYSLHKDGDVWNVYNQDGQVMFNLGESICEGTEDKREVFKQYAQPKVEELGEVIYTDTFEDDVTTPVLMIGDIRGYKNMKVTTDGDGSFIGVAEDGSVPIHTLVIDPFAYALRLEFKKISPKFFEDVLEYWDDMDLDDYMDDQMNESRTFLTDFGAKAVDDRGHIVKSPTSKQQIEFPTEDEAQEYLDDMKED